MPQMVSLYVSIAPIQFGCGSEANSAPAHCVTVISWEQGTEGRRKL